MFPILAIIPEVITIGRALIIAGSVTAAALTQTKKGKEITSSIKDSVAGSFERLKKNQADTKQLVKDIREGRLK